jgi:cytochrome oxidase Cu insertion factor (SCO1/SenC/PrrC family)
MNRKEMMLDILPYLKGKLSDAMKEDMHVVLVTVDSKGDAEAVSTLDRELTKRTFEGLVNQSYLIGGWN